MPVWKPPTSNSARRAAGDLAIRQQPIIRRETGFISDLQSLTGPHGPRAETRVIVNVVNAGAVIRTSQNDVVLVRQRVTTDTESYEEAVLAVDTGQGNLAPVGSTTVVQQPLGSETQEPYDPAGDVTAESTPEAAPPPAPETVAAGDVTVPELSAPTQENLQAQYGEDYATPAVPADAPLQENLEAQYGESTPDASAYEQQQANLAAAYDGV